MATTFHLRVWTRFFAPVEEVWRAKTDPVSLAAELSPWAAIRPADAEALAALLRDGRTGEVAASFRLGRALPVAWPMRVEEVVPGVSFRSTSTNRLFPRLEHDRRLELTPDGCRFVDALTFTSAVPAQKLAAIAVQRFFQHRHRVAAAAIAADPQATGVAVLRVRVEDEDDARAAG